MHNLIGIKEQKYYLFLSFSFFLSFLPVLGRVLALPLSAGTSVPIKRPFLAADVHEAREKAPLVIQAFSTHTTLSARLLDGSAVRRVRKYWIPLRSTLPQIMIIVGKREQKSHKL